MKELPRDELVLSCSCMQLDHVVRFSFFPTGPHDRSAFEAYVDVSLAYDKSFFRRLKTAFQYLFRKTCVYSSMTEVILRTHDVPKLRSWMERAEKDIEARNAIGDEHGKAD